MQLLLQYGEQHIAQLRTGRRTTGTDRVRPGFPPGPSPPRRPRTVSPYDKTTSRSVTATTHRPRITLRNLRDMTHPQPDHTATNN